MSGKSGLTYETRCQGLDNLDLYRGGNVLPLAGVMSDLERILGRFEQFMSDTQDKMRTNAADHQRIIDALDDLKAFKFKVMGASALISAVMTFVIKFL